jgi:glutathione S-transferase
MTEATLIISSKNYSAWSLRGWLMAKFVKLDFAEQMVSLDDAAARAELLLLSSSTLVPCLVHDGLRIWDTVAIGEYLAELKPQAGLLPPERAARARCRSICGEMHSGFNALRSALPMNLKRSHKGFKVWSNARADIERITTIWRDCFKSYGGPYLFGERSMADAMYAPVVARFRTYDVSLEPDCMTYCHAILSMPEFIEWDEAAKREPEDLPELESEF